MTTNRSDAQSVSEDQRAPQAPPDSPAAHVDEHDPNERPDGNNDTIHHPDDSAEQHPVKPSPHRRGPYVTGNY